MKLNGGIGNGKKGLVSHCGIKIPQQHAFSELKFYKF
jgi:hypothetical protein